MRLIELDNEIRSTQEELVKVLTSQLPSCGKQWVTFRPNSVELEMLSAGDGRLYFGSQTLRKEKKVWNAFGIYDATRQKQEITVEINFGLNGGRTAGFFANDGHRRFLLHTGRIGGGKPGVSQAAFLAWLKPNLVAVEDQVGKIRHGIVVGELGAGNLSDRIESFVQSARAFKDAVINGQLDNPIFQAEVEKWRDYVKEFSGRKTGTRATDLEYVSYHGDVVHAHKARREARGDHGVTITNSPLIDLLAHRNGKLVEIYEVKTSTTRQTLYAAIGQLIVHSSGQAGVARYIVLPSTGSVPRDIKQALDELHIKKLNFRIKRNDTVSINDG